MVVAQGRLRDKGKGVPQGLKPAHHIGLFGTTESRALTRFVRDAVGRFECESDASYYLVTKTVRIVMVRMPRTV